MDLTPEERRKIYEEEKARIEARERIEQEKRAPEQETSVNLAPNVAGFLCYLGVWITGIIFLAIEQKNNWIRFHAAQSLIIFGSLALAGLILGWIPVAGVVFSTILGITGFILWIVLMVKAYHGERYKVIIAGDIAEGIVSPSGRIHDYQGPEAPPKPEEAPAAATDTQEAAAPPEAAKQPETRAAEGVDLDKRIGRKVEDYFERRRAGRITGSAFAIAWSIILLVFFNFFHEYAAYYNADTTGNIVTWTKSPFFTSDISLWLPVLNAALAVAILGHVILIIFDGYVLRRIIRFIIDVLGLASVITLLSVYPFDFSVIPDTTIAAGVDVGVRVVLICISVGMGISVLVRFIKIPVAIARGTQ